MRIGYDVDGWGSRAFCKDLDFVGSVFFSEFEIIYGRT